jgi:3-hydroxymyristoyl/3-hydroxydecanoyl-(acyl carrier protein) dehydratase
MALRDLRNALSHYDCHFPRKPGMTPVMRRGQRAQSVAIALLL